MAKRLSVVPLGCPPAPVYEGGEEEAGQQGARQGEGSPTRTPVLVGFGPTLFSFYGRGKRGRRGSRRRKAGWRPLPKSNSASSLVLASLLWHIRPISFPGGFR